MHLHERHDTRPGDPPYDLSDCLDEMRTILFEGTYTSELRIELLLDRIERRR